jgi:carbonic anhydrase/acetyltransferase-like protein (isoleucine patch superfamily)
MTFLGQAPFGTNDTFIAPTASVIGEVTNWDQSSVWYGAVVRADSSHPITIGFNSSIGEGSVVTTLRKNATLATGFPPATHIGHYVSVGAGSVLKSCRVDDLVIIGEKCTILEGALVEANSVLEPGTVVPAYARIPGGQKWGGNPATFVANLTAVELENIKRTANETHERAKEHIKSTSTDDIEKKDYTGAAVALFGNIRIPAALIAGASAGAAFAMPALVVNEGLQFGTAKRLYSMLMMGSLSSQIVAVVVSTLAVTALSTRSYALTSSVQELLSKEVDLEWVAVRWHFLTGILFFLVAIGLRAWITISCPIISKGALGLIVSATLLCMAFIQDMESYADGVLSGFGSLRYVRLLVQRITQKKRPLFALAMGVSAMTSLFIASNIPHLYKYMTI